MDQQPWMAFLKEERFTAMLLASKYMQKDAAFSHIFIHLKLLTGLRLLIDTHRNPSKLLEPLNENVVF